LRLLLGRSILQDERKSGSLSENKPPSYGTPLYNKNIMKDYIKKLNFSKNEVARFRLEVTEFYKGHNLAATIDTFGVSRATIFRWMKKLKDSGGNLSSLIPKSRIPKKKRKMEVPAGVIKFISNLRKEHPRLGKKIKPLLGEYYKENDIK